MSQPTDKGDSRTVVIEVDHDEAFDYHEWINLGVRVAADRTGRRNKRITYRRWTEWTCNSTDCPARGIVSDELAIVALREAGRG